MAIIGLQSLVPTTILAIAVAAAGHAYRAEAAAVSLHDLQAKVDYCKNCHGVSGKVIAERLRCHGSPDSNPNTL
jgi:hypothetical protein